MWPVLILQPRPVNHDLCVSSAFELISICIKMKRLDRYWYGNSYFINILDEKIIQNCILSTGWHLNLIQNFYCYVLLKF